MAVTPYNSVRYLLFSGARHASECCMMVRFYNYSINDWVFMSVVDLNGWAKKLNESNNKPAYLFIADLIAADVKNGKLQPRDKLPGLREIADALQLNYTTIARAFNEAKNRGLIDSRPRAGTFIKGNAPNIKLSDNVHPIMTMNMSIEPTSPALINSIISGAGEVFSEREIYSLLRYDEFGGNKIDKEAGMLWLGRRLPKVDYERVLVSPGAHSSLMTLLTLLTAEKGLVCSSNLTYPGLKAIAAQLGINLHSIESDSSGPLVKPFETICKSGEVRALYINPTIQNPTTCTIPLHRREALADVALRYNIPIIEDDAYAMLPSTKIKTFAELAPELTYYISGLSKCFGPGLRIAYIQSPNIRLSNRLSAALRALTVMSSPITNALSTKWINDGTVDHMIREIRIEAKHRQKMASEIFFDQQFYADPEGFHLWLNVPKTARLNPSELALKLRSQGVSAVSCAAFSIDNKPHRYVRLCLGGPYERHETREKLLLVEEMLSGPQHLANIIF